MTIESVTSTELRDPPSDLSPFHAGLSEFEDDSELPLADRARPLVASHSQQGIWLAASVADDADRSLVASHSYRLRGHADVQALNDALNSVVVRHEVLRTGFVFHENELYQRVYPAEPANLDVVEMLNTSNESLTSAMHDFYRTTIDLERGPLLRWRFLRVAPDDHILMLLIHHIANDGWSMGILHDEISQLYALAIENGTLGSAELAHHYRTQELPVQYTDYAVWQRSVAETGGFDDDLSFWQDHLRGAPQVMELPLDSPRGSMRSFVGDAVIKECPAELMEKIRSVALDLNVTPFMLQFAAFQAILSSWTGQQDMILGVTLANRALPETERLIGYFVNTLPIRSVMHGQERFSAVLERTRVALMSSYDHAGVPFELILSKVRIPQAASVKPLVQVSVASHQELTEPLSLRNVVVEYLEPDRLDAQQDLILYLTAHGEEAGICLRYNCDLFSRSTIEDLAQCYLDGLAIVCAEPLTLLSEIRVPRRREAVGILEQCSETTATNMPTAAASPAEELVADIWREVLAGAELSPDSDFFALGGTSLAALRVVGRLSRLLGTRVPVRTIFEHSTLRTLAAHFEHLTEAAIAT